MGNYSAKQENEKGVVAYTEEENETWRILIERQNKIINNRACHEYQCGLDKLNLPHDRVPQCFEISKKLQATTGWAVKAVPALISLKEFFELLANKHFPAATFIRRREELDYLQEPDIFHEFYGHCPLLTNQAYADFIEWYGRTALTADKKVQSLLGRLFWFTIEFGLLNTNQGVRIFGGGILSSFEETVYALESPLPQRIPFNLSQVLDTPYRYDIIQDRYFVLKEINQLYEIQKLDIVKLAIASSMNDAQGKDFNIC